MTDTFHNKSEVHIFCDLKVMVRFRIFVRVRECSLRNLKLLYIRRRRLCSPILSGFGLYHINVYSDPFEAFQAFQTHLDYEFYWFWRIDLVSYRHVSSFNTQFPTAWGCLQKLVLRKSGCFTFNGSGDMYLKPISGGDDRLD